MSPAAPTRRPPVQFYVDEPVPTCYVELRWEAADGPAGELAIQGEATVVAEALVAIAARFSVEHTSGVRFAVPELEEEA